jgi:hypothetical protein
VKNLLVGLGEPDSKRLSIEKTTLEATECSSMPTKADAEVGLSQKKIEKKKKALKRLSNLNL